MQCAPRKDDIPVEKKPRWEAHAKRNDDGRNIRRDRPKTKMDIVLMQDIVIAEPIHHNIQQRGRSAARGIPEGLHRHDPAERRIKEIDECNDAFFQ